MEMRYINTVIIIFSKSIYCFDTSRALLCFGKNKLNNI